MGFLEKADKIAETALRGTAGFLETASKNASYRKEYTEEQRQAWREYSERMGDIRENGYRALSSIDDEDYYDDYNDDSYDDDEEDDDYYDNNDFDNDVYTEKSESNINISIKQKPPVKKPVKQVSMPKENTDKVRDCINKIAIRMLEDNKLSVETIAMYVGLSIGDVKKLYQSVEKQRCVKKAQNKKIRKSIKVQKDILMDIEKVQYVERRRASGYVLSGWIKKGGICQVDSMEIIVSHQDGTQSKHSLITISCKSEHKIYNYAQKGQYVRLFIEEDESFDMTTAVSVCGVIYDK